MNNSVQNYFVAAISVLNGRDLIKTCLPWLGSIVIVFILVAGIFWLDSAVDQPADTVNVRPIEVADIPPPPPPPTRQMEMKTEHNASEAPSIDVLGSGSGPALAFSEHPKMALQKMQEVEKPKINQGSLDLSENININFPLHQVEELDSIPRLVSNNHISFPRRMRESGIDKVATKVEIIIDAQGKAYVKKIVDPVYPEMVEVIRKAINDSRFTVPTKNGRAVQAVYLYSLTFINKI
jgi:periplasmic protein TonB